MSLITNRRRRAAPTQTTSATPDSILRAAADVFAENGFRNATVREICRRAGANIAAVNYHFGDKEKLYLEVLRRSHAQALKRYPPDSGLEPKAKPEERLRAFVRAFLLRLLDAGPNACHGKLVSMEMIAPTAALETLVGEWFEPMAEELLGILRPLLGRGANEEVLRLCGCSVVSQCVFYHHCGSVVSRMFPQQGFRPQDLERLAEHITAFSLAALHQFRVKPQRRWK